MDLNYLNTAVTASEYTGGPAVRWCCVVTSLLSHDRPGPSRSRFLRYKQLPENGGAGGLRGGGGLRYRQAHTRMETRNSVQGGI